MIDSKIKKLIEDAAYEIEQNVKVGSHPNIYSEMTTALTSTYEESKKIRNYAAKEDDHVHVVCGYRVYKLFLVTVSKASQSMNNCHELIKIIDSNIQGVRNKIESKKSIPAVSGLSDYAYGAFYTAVYCQALCNIIGSGYFGRFYVDNIDEVAYEVHKNAVALKLMCDGNIPKEMIDKLHRSKGMARAFKKVAASYGRPRLVLLPDIFDRDYVRSVDCVGSVMKRVHTEKLKYITMAAAKKYTAIAEAHE